MANPNRLIEIQLRKIKAVVYRECKQILAQEIKDRLIDKIFENFYDRYGVGDSGWLIDSIDIKVEPNNDMSDFIVYVYWKNNRLRHTSLFGSKDLSINKGQFVYDIEWINDGFTYLPNGNGERINEHGDVMFIEDCIDDLQFNSAWIHRFYDYLRKNGIDITT